MAAQAVAAARKVVRMGHECPGLRRIGGDIALRERGVEQSPAGLRVVPLIGVALPSGRARALDQKTGLERASRRGVAALELERELLDEHGPVGEIPRALRMV